VTEIQGPLKKTFINEKENMVVDDECLEFELEAKTGQRGRKPKQTHHCASCLNTARLLKNSYQRNFNLKKTNEELKRENEKLKKELLYFRSDLGDAIKPYSALSDRRKRSRRVCRFYCKRFRKSLHGSHLICFRCFQ
jgi:superfamily I DNA and/or RNA helicase